MTYPIQPYQEPPSQLPGPPTEFNLGGNKYVLVSPEQQAPVVPYQHHQGPVIGGVPYVMTHEGYRPIHQAQALGYSHGPAPYHASPWAPPWVKNHYTRTMGILIGGSTFAIVIAVLGIGAYAIVSAAVHAAFMIGMVMFTFFIGTLMFLGALTRVKHGHKPGR